MTHKSVVVGPLVVACVAGVERGRGHAGYISCKVNNNKKLIIKK